MTATTSTHRSSTTVEVFGNLVDATRGESVIDEVLGSGNASVAFQRFKLKKSPLTYLSDATLDSGVRPEIEVRVNGVAWTYVETLFGTGPEDEVYTLQQDESAVTSVIFGDGETGARPATGSGQHNRDVQVRCRIRQTAGRGDQPASQAGERAIGGDQPGARSGRVGRGRDRGLARERAGQRVDLGACGVAGGF